MQGTPGISGPPLKAYYISRQVGSAALDYLSDKADSTLFTTTTAYKLPIVADTPFGSFGAQVVLSGLRNIYGGVGTYKTLRFAIVEHRTTGTVGGSVPYTPPPATDAYVVKRVVGGATLWFNPFLNPLEPIAQGLFTPYQREARAFKAEAAADDMALALASVLAGTFTVEAVQ